MRKMILALAILYPAAAFAQGTTAPAPANPPPTVGGKPLVQVGSKKPAAAEKEAAGKTAGQAPIRRAEAAGVSGHRRRDQGTAAAATTRSSSPQPKPKPPAAKGVNDCRFLKEEDERLTCYNGFADKIPKLPR